MVEDPYLPDALGRDAVPWDQVGDGWYVVLYDPSKAYPVDAADVREGPAVLYLVTAWPAGIYVNLVDATATSALVARQSEDVDLTDYQFVDLTTGEMSVAYTSDWPESSYVSSWPPASLTRPTGANVVVHLSDGSTEWLERRSSGGSVLSRVLEQPYVEGDRSIAWLYGHEGTSIVVAHRDGVRQVGIDGSLIAELWSPPETVCDPVRWWDSDIFLAACYGLGPASAPFDEYGEPHIYYGRLWLIDTDGTAGVPLTDFPADPPIVVDFGYHDAWPTDDDIYLQWSGDCGASRVATLQPDGTGEFVPVTVPSDLVTDGVAMVDIFDGEKVVYGWEGCAGDVGELFRVDLNGDYIGTLVEAIDDARGVTGVVGLGKVGS